MLHDFVSPSMNKKVKSVSLNPTKNKNKNTNKLKKYTYCLKRTDTPLKGTLATQEDKHGSRQEGTKLFYCLREVGQSQSFLNDRET